MLYEVEVIYKHTIVDIEANSEEEAIEKAAEMAWQLDADETSTKVLRCWNPDAPPSYQEGDHFIGAGGEFVITAILPKVVFYEEVGSTSTEGTMVDKTKFEEMILNGTVHSQRKETLLEMAMRLVDNYIVGEFESRADFSDMSRIPAGHTTTEEEDLPVQIYVDLVNFSITRYLMGVLVETRKYDTLEDFVDMELTGMDFSDLTWFTDEQIAYARSMDAFPVFMTMDTSGMAVTGLPGTWHVTDHQDVNGRTFWLMANDEDAELPPIIVDDCGECCIESACNGFSLNNVYLLERLTNAS